MKKYEWQMYGEAGGDGVIQERWRQSPAGQAVIRKLIGPTPPPYEYSTPLPPTTMSMRELPSQEPVELDEAV